MKKRIDYIDNLKGLGIILVVFGHYIEPFRNMGFILNALFICIYFFHMPMFALASGVVAKLSLEKVVRYIWILYISQAFYMVIRFLIGNYEFVSLKSFIVSFIGYPYFQLWYLYACVFWLVSLIMASALKNQEKSLGGGAISLAFILCLIAGYINFRFELNRVIAFYVFFLTGYILKDKILFLETSEDEIAPEFIEYYLRNLIAQGIIDEISGIIVGKPQNETYYEEYKEVYQRLISEEAHRPELPILYNVNFGHTAPMCILPFGLKVKINLEKKQIMFMEKPMKEKVYERTHL